jgi:tetratricopeptide (TPR) repeat protein/predicted Ser/Thr protein kinase
MDPSSYARVAEIFLTISSLPEAELAAALERECAGDAKLRAEVESLLAHRREESLFASRAPAPDASRSSDAFPAGPIGQRIGGIVVEKRLAEGGMGTVYRGFDERLRRRVALKSLRGEWRLEPEARARFRREARVLSQLKHPNICEIHGYEETPDSDYLVLEYIDGRSLKKAIADGLPLAERDRIAATLAEVLQVAHGAGVVHRDLKPDNVMLTANGQLKVLDFGIARIAPTDATLPLGSMISADASSSGRSAASSALPSAQDSSSLKTRAGLLMGTPRYMAPEQARGEVATPASDIYALGLILYEMYTGRSASSRHLGEREFLEWRRAGRIEPLHGMSRERRRLVERMLSREPPSRPTAAEVSQELKRIRELLRRRLRQVLVAAVLVLVALAGAKYVSDVQAERAQAEAARAQAERLVNFLLDELHEELRASERREVVDRVSRETLRYFEELPEPRQRASAIRIARALRHQGAVLAQRGDVRAARAAYERALRLDEQALSAAASPREVTEALDGVGNDLRILATAAWDENDLETGSKLTRRALDVYTRLAREHPGETRWQGTLALTWEHLAWNHLFGGDLAASNSAFKHAVEIYHQLLEREPGNRTWRFHLGDVSRVIGDNQYFLGEVDAAIASYSRSCRLLEALATEDPDVFNYSGFAAEGLLSMGRALARKGDLTGALAVLEKARGTFARNHERDPSRRRWRYLLLRAHLFASRVLRQQGEERAARERLEQAVPLTVASDAVIEEEAVWAEVQLELGRREEARPVVERLVARGWQRTLVHSEFAELARRHGFLPTAGGSQGPEVHPQAHGYGLPEP